jgi:DNA-binding CsgD family transcriptional regulator
VPCGLRRQLLSDSERLTLMKWARGRGTARRLVQRAMIILAATSGMRNDEIAGELGCTRRTVGT